MKKLLTLAVCMCLMATLHAQSISGPPSGDNQKSTVTQWIGPASVTITYSSPNVHGPSGEDRTGHIWGELVHYGFIDQGYGSSKAAPWRAGANENTTITFSHDVTIGGKQLKAGTYALFLDVEKEGPWTWIFSTNAMQWGSYYYDAKDDALRVQATPADAAYSEYLSYNFIDREASSATAVLQWEKKSIAFKIDVPNVNQIYVDKIRGELLGTTLGFNYRPWMEAAQFCAQNKINLPEALTWADNAISGQYIGVEDFESMKTKALVLYAMNRNDEADALMEKAIHKPTAGVQAIHQYGKSLLAAGKKEKALAVFKHNRQANPTDTFTTYVGLARGYTAVNDKKNAVKNWEIAIKNLPENQKANLPAYQAELQKLK